MSTHRHGKHLFVQVERDAWLRMHFGMTGYLQHLDGRHQPSHMRFRLDFSDGSFLAYVDTRRLGHIGWVDDIGRFIVDQQLGPDALAADFTRARFRDRLQGRRGTLKSTLMNQEVIAGLGNIYVDEILFQAGVGPKARTEQLKPETVKRLHQAMRRVLEAAIAAEADPERFPNWFFLPYRNQQATCPRCGGRVQHTTISGRSTYYCPRDQRATR